LVLDRGRSHFASFTIISCAAAIVRAGAVPWSSIPTAHVNMTAEGVAAAMTPKTKASWSSIFTGYRWIWTNPCSRGQAWLEDHRGCAEMHGRLTGSAMRQFWRDLDVQLLPEQTRYTARWMILTDDLALAEKCRSLRNLCFQARTVCPRRARLELPYDQPAGCAGSRATGKHSMRTWLKSERWEGIR